MVEEEEEKVEERRGAIQRRDMARPNKYRPQVNFPFTRNNNPWQC